MNTDKIKKLFGIKTGETPETRFVDNLSAVKVQLVDWPDLDRIERVFIDMSKAPWFKRFTDDPEITTEELSEELTELLNGKTLGQGMEHAIFCFVVEGLSLHGTHALVRNRIGVTYMQQSQAVQDFRHSDILVPRAFTKIPKLLERYERWVLEGKHIYADMLDSGAISNTDARFCLPKTIPNWCYVSITLPTLLSMYGKRSDSQEEHPEMNIMVSQMRTLVTNKMPYLDKHFVKFDDAGKCLHQKSGYSANCVFKRDEKHQLPQGSEEDGWTLHDKTKAELMLDCAKYKEKKMIGFIDERN